MSGLEQFLISALVLISSLCLYLYWKAYKSKVDEEAQPLDTVLVSWFALLFVFIIFCSFIYFGENKITIGENIGQVGDFIGGLTNPVLSFLALLVLLRTTSIQTAEARKTTKFMELQQSILEGERFESTFFHLLQQLESFCELHFRLNDKGNNPGEELAEKLYEKYHELSKLEKDAQIAAAKKHIDELATDNNCVILSNRAMRVVRFLNNSKIDIRVRKSYAAILRDTIYPDECIIISSFCFALRGNSAELLKKWGVVDLNREYFVCEEIEFFYKGKPSAVSAVQLVPSA